MMHDWSKDPLERLMNGEEREAINKINTFRRTDGCYRCRFSKMKNGINECSWEVEGYPDMSLVEDHENYCKFGDRKDAKK